MGHVGYGSYGSWVIGHVGHNGSWIMWIIGTWVVGNGSLVYDGSCVLVMRVMGHMGHGSRGFVFGQINN